MADTGPSTILVTGAAGNLGGKLVSHLVGLPWVRKIYCLDVRPMTGGVYDSSKVAAIVADLGDANDQRWYEAAETADAIVHFAVRNPSPTGDWNDAVIAVDMTANLLNHANGTSCRFVYASSNHAMGGYKNLDLSSIGKLSSKTPPLPGTPMWMPSGYVAPNMYGGSKLVGERLIRAKAIASAGTFTGVALRIGWCLSDDDGPERIGRDGPAVAGSARQSPEDYARDTTWYRNMWLSRGDFTAEFTAALTADANRWPEPGIVVNAMSGNRGMVWDMDEARDWLGHIPKDDVWTALGIDPPRQ